MIWNKIYLKRCLIASMIAFGASLSHKTFLITASKCELMPGYVPRMAMKMAFSMPAPKWSSLLDLLPHVLYAFTLPLSLPLSLASPAHHQWGNLWNAILTFSKVSFIAYMRHLRARASVSVFCCHERRSSLTQPLRCRCSKRDNVWRRLRLPPPLPPATAFDWRSCSSCLCHCLCCVHMCGP